jgi:tRNA threonylcarbamoyladenosine biosynthesis protein TsaB
MALCADSVYEEMVDPSAKGEILSASLDNLLAKVGATLDDVKRVMVTVGPGSFSGLRTGVAFCQGLCFSGKRNLYGVTTLQALACFAYAPNESVAVVIRARNGFWYLRLNNEESFIETADVVARLQASSVKNVVVDAAALADEALVAVFKEKGIATTLDTEKPLSMWIPLFETVKPSLIQEANYIQPSYFEKLKT